MLLIHNDPRSLFTKAENAKANGTVRPTYPKYNVGGWMAIVKFCSKGFKPLPFWITKSVSVGLKGLVIKLVALKRIFELQK